jgi:membrane protein DedA with SNARE-associated domain
MTTSLILTLLPLVLTSALDVLEWLVRLPVEIFQAYSSLLRWAADSVQDLFEEYGYWVVFFGTLSENTLLVGLIVPGALVVILAGLAAHDGTISVPISIGLGICGTIIGDTLSYFMGRYGWSRFGHLKLLSELSEKVREPLMRRGVWFVLFYHFAGYTRVIGPTAAGLLRMPYRQWALADYGGAVLWILGYFAIGYLLGIAGLTLDSTDRWFRIVEWGLLIAMFFWVQMMLKAHTEFFSSGSKPSEEQSNNQTAEDRHPESTPSAEQEEPEPTR